MQQFQSILLNVWREACRHIELAESASVIVPILRKDLPIEGLCVFRIDHDEYYAETVFAHLPDAAGIELAAQHHFSKKETKELIDWCEEGSICHFPSKGTREGIIKSFIPKNTNRHIVVGPLAGSDNNYGALVVIAEDGGFFGKNHCSLLQELLDPFSVALENDARLRELSVLRNAAEARNQSLLSRLGRKSLGDTIVGADSGLREVMDRVELVAGSDAPVLILGETGSGKELIARSIHNRSHRKDHPFIRVNCGAIPPELIDSQLFGHEKGSFTGASSQHKGWFERADTGTLLLDEIAELPQAAQVRLLRVLQDGLIERVGSQKSIHVNVRIVAATHRDLPGMVAAGSFREDLWYRIAVFPIVLPPLKNRREDIPSLTRHFARRAATRFGLEEVVPTENDIAVLSSYDWPGNIRELGAVIDRAAILGNGETLEVQKALGASNDISSKIPDNPEKNPETVQTSEISPLDKAIKHHIEAALMKTRGRVEGTAGAASLLEINPNTLRAKMRKLQINWQSFR